MIGVTENLAEIQRFVADSSIEAGRDPGTVTLVAVSKRQAIEKIATAADSGQRDFGENFASEGIAKRKILADRDLIWHFIGAIQSNKTRSIAENFDWVHTIDRARIAERLNRQRSVHAAPLNVCLQVNIDGEASKSGVGVEQTHELAAAVGRLPRLRLRGLMCLPRPAADFDSQRRPFARLRSLLDELNSAGLHLDTLSMGMSNDLRAAIFEGATHVRVGTAIFGTREPTRAGIAPATE